MRTTFVCTECRNETTREHQRALPTRCLACEAKHRALIALHRDLAARAGRRREATCYVCNRPSMRPGVRCHACTRQATGFKRASVYPCRECGGFCTKKGGRCRACSGCDEVIGTYEHPSHPDPWMRRRLAELHERAKRGEPLFPERAADYTEAARAS